MICANEFVWWDLKQINTVREAPGFAVARHILYVLIIRLRLVVFTQSLQFHGDIVTW